MLGVLSRSSLDVKSSDMGRIYLVPSSDSERIYTFSNAGLHLRTLSASAGETIFEFHYDDQSRLVGITDRHGRKTEIQRSNGEPTAIIGPDGLTTDLDTYTGPKHREGFLKKVTNPAGESVRFDYYAPNNNTECESDGSNCEGLLKSMTEPDGAEHTYNYDKQGRLESDTGPENFQKTLNRNQSHKGDDYSVEVESAAGLKTTYHTKYEKNDEVDDYTRITETPTGQTSRRVTEDDGTKIYTASDGTKVTYSPKPGPRFGSSTPTEGSVELETPGGRKLRSSIDRNFEKADSAEFSFVGEITTERTVGSRTFEKQFTPNVSRQSDRHEVKTTYPSGRTVRKELTPEGRVKRVERPGLHPIVYTYRSDGKLDTVEMAPNSGAKRVWSYSYSSNGFVEDVTGPAGHTTNYTRDPVGRVEHKTLPGSQTPASERRIDFSYDQEGNLEGLTPPGRPAHEFTLDDADRPTKYIPPTGAGGTSSEVQYVYDSDHYLDKLIQPDGGEIDLVYEKGTHRVNEIVASNTKVDLTYNQSDGHLSSQEKIDTNTGSVVNGMTFQRDGSLLERTAWTKTGSEVAAVERSYNGNLEQSGETVVDGTGAAYSVSMTYTSDGQLDTVGQLDLRYDQTSGLLKRGLIGSTEGKWTRNGFAEPETYRVSGPSNVLYDVEYTYDDRGQIETVTETTDGETKRLKYGYDPRGRLTTVWNDANGDGNYTSSEITHEYTWGPNGNRLSVDTPARSISSGDITHDDQDRLTQYGRWEFRYTTSGELKRKTDTQAGETTEFVHDDFGNLSEVILPDGRRVTYESDPTQRRIIREVLDAQGNTTDFRRYVYRDSLNPVATLDQNGELEARFVYGEKPWVPSYMVKDGTTYRLVTDHLGSVRAVVDVQTGEVKQRLDYGPFGRVLEDTNPGFQPFGFAGGLYDPATGLVQFNARNYDPVTGRWLKKDGIGFTSGEANMYGYVSQDPVNFIDPSGHALDTVADASFVGYDIYRIVNDNLLGDCDNLGANLAALGADTAGLALPFVTGLGAASRGARYSDEAVDTVAKTLNKSDDACFTAETPVQTRSGEKPIAEVEVGDYVRARDPETGREDWRQVTDTTVREDVPVLRLEVESTIDAPGRALAESTDSAGRTETLTTTAEHPFWVRHDGWRAAAELEPGDEVYTSRGGWLKVTSGTWLAERRTVHNLEVAGHHTYFVGEAGVWVHNTCILKPDTRDHVNTVGPHTVYKRSDENGRVSDYVTFDQNPHYPRNGGFVKKKRFRGEGREHNGTDPEFVRERPSDANPGANLGEPRDPADWEVPNGYDGY